MRTWAVSSPTCFLPDSGEPPFFELSLLWPLCAAGMLIEAAADSIHSRMDGYILANRVLQDPLWPAFAAAPEFGLLLAQLTYSAFTKPVGCETGYKIWHCQGSNCKTVHR